jgi:uncharacterized protein YjbI with pentapeptide repeats
MCEFFERDSVEEYGWYSLVWERAAKHWEFRRFLQESLKDYLSKIEKPEEKSELEKVLDEDIDDKDNITQILLDIVRRRVLDLDENEDTENRDLGVNEVLYIIRGNEQNSEQKNILFHRIKSTVTNLVETITEQDTPEFDNIPEIINGVESDGEYDERDIITELWLNTRSWTTDFNCKKEGELCKYHKELDPQDAEPIDIGNGEPDCLVGMTFKMNVDEDNILSKNLDFCTICPESDKIETDVGESSFRFVKFSEWISFSGVTFKDGTDFRGAIFEGLAYFREADFGGKAYFRKADFEKWANFKEADFKEGLDFRYTDFGGEANFADADFEEWADFKKADFGGETHFMKADFEEWADFKKADFGGETHFMKADFGGTAQFSEATFEYEARFDDDDTIFEDQAKFNDVTFEDQAKFNDVTFKKGNDAPEDEADKSEVGGCFSGARFKNEAEFNNATFECSVEFGYKSKGESADLEGSTFESRAQFKQATFKHKVKFNEVTFETANFTNTDFGGTADFEEADFGGEADFADADFGGEADFKKADFGGEADFADADFEEWADFREAHFGGEADIAANFKEAHFGGGAYFRYTDFGGEADFADADFEEWADFREAHFGGEADIAANFKEADFGGEAVFEGADFEGLAYFREADFAEKAEFEEAKFKHYADFTDSKFSGVNNSFSGVKFNAVQFIRATFSGRTDFNRAWFGRVDPDGGKNDEEERDMEEDDSPEGTSFDRATFEGDVFFTPPESVTQSNGEKRGKENAAEFYGKVDFFRASFQGKADFGYCQFKQGAEEQESQEGEAKFRRATFERELNLEHSEFCELTMERSDFYGFCKFSDAEFEKIEIHSAEFHRTLNLNNVTVEKDMKFQRSIFRRELYMNDSVFGEHKDAKLIDFNGAIFEGEIQSYNDELVKKDGEVIFEENIDDDDYEDIEPTKFQAKEIDFSKAEFRRNETFDKAEFGKLENETDEEEDHASKINFEKAKFERGDSSFEGASFHGKTIFRHARFRDGDADFTGAKFKRENDKVYEDIEENDEEFNGVVTFVRTEFSGGDAIFEEGEFKDTREDVEDSDGEFPFKFERAEFTGGHATFGPKPSDDLDNETQEPNSTRTEFNDDVSFREAKFRDGHAEFRGVCFSGMTDFSDAEFSGGDANFQQISCERAKFRRAKFGGGDARFQGSEFESKESELPDNCDYHFDFQQAKFTGGHAIFGTRGDEGGEKDVSKPATFEDSSNGKIKVSFREAKFRDGNAEFGKVKFIGFSSVDFTESEFSGGKVCFDEAKFNRGESDGESDSGEQSENKDSYGVDFRGSEFSEGVASFCGLSLSSNISFEDSKFLEGIEIQESGGEKRNKEISFRGSRIEAGSLLQPEGCEPEDENEGCTYYDLSEAEVGDIILTEEDSTSEKGSIKANDVLDYYRFWETSFDGLDFAGQFDPTGNLDIHEYTRNERENGDQDEKEMKSLRETYLKAKNGANFVDADDIAKTFFIKEMKYKGRLHKLKTKDRVKDIFGNLRKPVNVILGLMLTVFAIPFAVIYIPLRSIQILFKEVLPENARLVPRFVSSGLRYVSNSFLRVFSGYGESPARTVFISMGIVGLGAVGYIFTDWVVVTEGGGGAMSDAIFSLQNFVGATLKPAEEVTLLGRLLSGSLSFMGAFMIALFVFTLTRAVKR